MLTLSQSTETPEPQTTIPPAAASGKSESSGFGWTVMILVPMVAIAVGYAIGYERGSTATPRVRRSSHSRHPYSP